MSLVKFILTVFVWVDDSLKLLFSGRTPRCRRGPRPTLSDSKVLTREIVGEFLGYDTDEGIFTYFRGHWPDLLPALVGVHRSEFVRQAARLLRVKERRRPSPATRARSREVEPGAPPRSEGGSRR